MRKYLHLKQNILAKLSAKLDKNLKNFGATLQVAHFALMLCNKLAKWPKVVINRHVEERKEGNKSRDINS